MFPEDPFSQSGPDDVIASFSFESNALLQLIEERKPGTLQVSGRSYYYSDAHIASDGQKVGLVRQKKSCGASIHTDARL